MIRIVAEPGVFHGVEMHLEKAEQVGFFLADYEAACRTFRLCAWRPILGDGYDLQTDVHVSLGDPARADVIKWAWQENLSLVEVHSHGKRTPAQFSGSDLYGFREWVSHLWWRLQGRPYAAIVTAGDTFDAWAWIDTATAPEQIIELDAGGRVRVATAKTFKSFKGSNGV